MTPRRDIEVVVFLLQRTHVVNFRVLIDEVDGISKVLSCVDAFVV